MSRRSTSWNKNLAEDMKDINFIREFVRASLEECLPIQIILGKIIRSYGVKEFAAKVKLPSSNLLRAINPKHNPTINTINRILKPFDLEITISPVNKKRVA